MYSRCLFCSSSLGANTDLEHLPVGRRVAFDAARGRLWAVCPRCGRWNLVPFEERWEALDECARLAERSLVEEAGEELSLLKHPSGLSLIRIGKPALAELVSWRFARSMVWRRRAYLLSVSAATGYGGAVLFGVATGGALFAGMQGLLFARAYRDLLWPVIRMETSDGRRIRATVSAALGSTFRPGEGGPVLDVDFRRSKRHGKEPHRLEGPDVGHFLARAMPYVNQEGASERLAVEAAAVIEARGGRERFLETVAADRELLGGAVFRHLGARRAGVLSKLPRPVRLGLEVVSHVEQEERAMAGQLKSVMAEWREAEEIAGIADSLLEPPGWGRLRVRSGSSAGEDAEPRPDRGL